MFGAFRRLSKGGLMKNFLPLYLLLLLAVAPCADAAYYQWTDAKGVVHLTNNRDSIPAKYRSKARKVLSETPPATKGSPPAAQTPAETPSPQPAAAPQAPPASQPQASQPQAPMPGGHDEKWWRDRFTTLKQQLESTQKKISENQAKMVELRRKRVIYQRARDREAVNAMEAELAANESQLNELQKQLDAFQNDAAKADVPRDWLR
jgi:hypothetical protein